MPIYEFVCQDCGYEFEKITSFSDTSAPACPQCAQTHVERQVSRPAIHFKGSGWYITDSKTSGKKPATDSANGAGTGESKADDAAKGDTKSDAKSESKSSPESTAAPVKAAAD